MTAPEWRRFAEAVPLAAAAVHGLGPVHLPGPGSPSDRLRQLSRTRDAVRVAVESAGRLGAQMLTVLSFHGGRISQGQLEAETAGADPGRLDEAVRRLIDASLLRREGTGLRMTSAATEVVAPVGMSLSDPQAITSDALALMCKQLTLPMAGRKQDRIDAIAARLGSDAGRLAVRAALSQAALGLLDRLAVRAGPTPVASTVLGLSAGDLREAEPAQFAFQSRRISGRALPLQELCSRGIVGVDPWNEWLWIWREGWPLAERPIFHDWAVAARPATAPVMDLPLQVPSIVAVMGRALQHWDASPPPVLKGGALRLGKPALRATAKVVGSDEAIVHLIASSALSLGLLLSNVVSVSVSGRGRNRVVDQVWRADPDARSAWDALPAPARWLRLVADWTSPPNPDARQLLANRHLLLWELSCLPPGQGLVDDRAVAAWLQDRYLPTGVAEAFSASVDDLRALGLATAAPTPLALTAIGRLALGGPRAVLEADFGGARDVIVQSDQTIVCPADLDPELKLRIAELARLESEGGASVFRLDRRLITGAVQRGDSEKAILAFLAAVSTVGLPTTVTHLVADAARDAERFRLLPAATVLVTRDPADLVHACRVQAAQLTAVSDTVALSPLPAGKVRAALDRKHLAASVIDPTASAPTARRAADDAVRLLELAAIHKGHAAPGANTMRARMAADLTRQAEELTNPGRRFAVTAPLALTPSMLEA